MNENKDKNKSTNSFDSIKNLSLDSSIEEYKLQNEAE